MGLKNGQQKLEGTETVIVGQLQAFLDKFLTRKLQV